MEEFMGGRVVAHSMRWGDCECKRSSEFMPFRLLVIFVNLSNMARGFRVTTTAGTGNRRIVVMSKCTKLDKQVFSPGGVFPNDWIMGNWK